MPPRRAKESGLPAVSCPVLFDYSEQLAILLFGQLMKWLRPMVRRGDSIPLADLRDALWAVKSWNCTSQPRPRRLPRNSTRSIDVRIAGPVQRRLQAHLAHRRKVAEAEDQWQPPPAELMSAAEHDALRARGR